MHFLRRLSPLALAALLGLAGSSAAKAQTWNANLDGISESPPNGSPGTGFATFTLTGDNLAINITFSGLVGTTTASHLHCCTAVPGTGTAGVASTTPTFLGFPIGVTSGSYSNTLDLTLNSSWNPSFIAAHGATAAGAEAFFLAGLSAGEVYVNIHTNVFPGGEIRGFLVEEETVAPEPATLGLVAGGLLIMAAVRRKRRA
jgi:hypothetical protein